MTNDIDNTAIDFSKATVFYFYDASGNTYAKLSDRVDSPFEVFIGPGQFGKIGPIDVMSPDALDKYIQTLQRTLLAKLNLIRQLN